MRGDRIREKRESLGLSQTDLAEQVGTGQKRVSAWERGESGATDDMIVGLARALQTSSDWILGLTDDPTPRPGDLIPKEEKAIALWRRGEITEAIKVMVSG